MNIIEIKKKTRDYLFKQDEIIFAYHFGSSLNKEKYRDIDLAIYTVEGFGLLKLGKLRSDLCTLLDSDIDIIRLNDICHKNPVFVYEVVTEGELLFTRNEELHTTFKKNVFLCYFDTKILRDSVDEAFEKRLQSNQFGQRDYVT